MAENKLADMSTDFAVKIYKAFCDKADTFCSLLPRLDTFYHIYGNKKRTFVYQDKGAFFE